MTTTSKAKVHSRRRLVHITTTLLAGSISLLAAGGASAQSLTIGTVNNGDMIRMQQLSDEFTSAHPDITLNWVTLEENVLRQRVTTDIATQGGQFDIMTIGTYEVPIWAEREWLVPLDDLGADYEAEDLLPKIRDALSYEGTLYAAPFYGESSFIMYRTDLMEAAGLAMPEDPTWEFIGEAARAMTDRENDISGICLRGKAGWGENMAFLAAMSNSFGGRWFDEDWEPQFDQPEWKEALQFYVDLMNDAGPAGASSNGFNENLALFQQGKCGMWIDATVAASFVTNPSESTVAEHVGFALAPHKDGVAKNANWIWSWALAIPAGSQKVDAAKLFIEWATSKGYTELVAANEGWANVPPGTRTSLYENAEYLEAAPFAELTIESINLADSLNPTVEPVPYVGVTFPSIPEYPAIGTSVGQIFSAALAGQVGIDDALAQAQEITRREMERGGYYE